MSEKRPPDAEYSADSIQVLTGLEPVRKRPGMYVGDTRDGTGLHHLLWEIVGNSIDECLAGEVTRLVVSIEGEGGALSVEDDGRGIPVELVPIGEEPISALEWIMTRLHAGATRDGHTPHVHVGARLHGVGLAAVNALSARLQVDVWRGGRHHRMAFARGEITTPLTDMGAATRRGTRIELVPDPDIFTGVTALDPVTVDQRLSELAYLNPGLTVERDGRVFHAPRGLAGWVEALAAESGGPVDDVFFVRGEHGKVSVDVAIAWTGVTAEARVESFVSQYRTRDGGVHVQGLWAGLRAAYKEAAGAGPGLDRGDLDAALGRGLIAIVHAGLYDPVFGSPTKDRLTSPEARRAVRALVAERLPGWLRERPALLAAIQGRLEAQSRG